MIPVKYKEVPIGVVVLGKSSRFDKNQLTRIDLFTRNLGLALNNAVVHEQLRRMAALDPLTGVYNRRFGMRRLHEEFARAVRTSSPLGVLILDVDHFKKVNDTYGHLVGDKVLKSVAEVTRNVRREGDLLLRFGGEEFLIVLPAAARDDLKRIGERIRRAVGDCSVSEGSTTIKVTASLGGAAYPSDKVDDEEALVRLADEALYQAKQSGRSRAEIAA